MIIEETLRQRYEGVKNEKGVWITPAFPKLIYVLEEDNVREGTPYFYLTRLAAECTAKRMVPDYISEKKMLENTGVWVCTVCGFVYVGNAAPDLCPVCKVPSWKFEKVEGRA